MRLQALGASNMKPSHLLFLGLTALAPAAIGCAEREEMRDPQFPEMPGAESVEGPLQGPGEAPAPIDVDTRAPVAPPSAPAAPPPQAQRIVPGETTEQEWAESHPEGESDEYADQDPSALTDFHAALDPYGSWVEDPSYGTVWTPDPSVVGDDFTPYMSSGHWTYDDYQSYVWVSDYDWGWAPFHYGRWARMGDRWGWVPGRRYAGAWVTWRTGIDGYDYLGWAPLAPRWGWRSGIAFDLAFAPLMPWVFCGTHDVFTPGFGGRVYSGPAAQPIAAHSRVFAAPTTPGAGGRVIAHPTVGPPPPSVGIRPNEVARVPPVNRGILHAIQYARPSTAQGYGAHAALASSDHYVHGLGNIRSDEPIARAPQYRGVAPAQHYFPSHSIGGLPAYGSAPHFPSGYSSRPYYAPYEGVHGGAPYYGAGGYHGGAPYYPGVGGYHGGPVHAGTVNGSSQPGDPNDAPLHPWGGGTARGGRGGARGGGGGAHGGGGRR